MNSWENFDISVKVLGAENDYGDVLVLKSGTDFRDLSELTLELEGTPPNSIRAKIIKKIAGEQFVHTLSLTVLKEIPGKRHSVKPGSKSSAYLQKLLKTLLSGISSTLKAPVCKTTVMLDVRSQAIRTAEVFWLTRSKAIFSLMLQLQSAAGNWFADIIRHAYDDALCMKGLGGSDGVFICAGTLRGDSTYGPG